jgi:hypothetical protein
VISIPPANVSVTNQSVEPPNTPVEFLNQPNRQVNVNRFQHPTGIEPPNTPVDDFDSIPPVNVNLANQSNFSTSPIAKSTSTGIEPPNTPVDDFDFTNYRNTKHTIILTNEKIFYKFHLRNQSRLDQKE